MTRPETLPRETAMNTTEFLMVTSAIVPDREAIVFEDSRFTYGALQRRSSQLANALTELGVRKGRPGRDARGELQSLRRGLLRLRQDWRYLRPR